MDTIEAIGARHARFNSVVQRIREAGTDSLSHFGNGYTHEGGYSLQQNPLEFAALALLLWERCRGGAYLEIGSASGGALRFLHGVCDFSWLGSMDNHGHHRWVEQEKNWNGIYWPATVIHLEREYVESREVEQFVGDSHSGEARQWLYGVVYPISAAFIDGDHSYEGVTQDTQLVREVLKPGALLVLHDIVAVDGVRRAWEEAASWARPIARYVGAERPLGIGVLEVVK